MVTIFQTHRSLVLKMDIGWVNYIESESRYKQVCAGWVFRFLINKNDAVEIGHLSTIAAMLRINFFRKTDDERWLYGNFPEQKNRLRNIVASFHRELKKIQKPTQAGKRMLVVFRRPSFHLLRLHLFSFQNIRGMGL